VAALPERKTIVSDPSVTARRAEAGAWCEVQAKELSAAILHVPAVAAKLPFPQYGAICRQALSYAVELGAADLIPELGETELVDGASMAEALRQVHLLAGWLAESEGTTESGSSERPIRTPNDQPSVEQLMERVAQAVGDENAVKVLTIANRKDWSGERKMEEIIRLDTRFAGKDSNEWATLLGVTAAAVRSYGLWKRLQKAKKSGD
jgi:hypothetical protein